MNESINVSITSAPETKTTDASALGLMSLTDWMSETDRAGGQPSLSMLKMTTEPVYVSVFTDQGAPVVSHYLEITDGWSGGYVHCLGAGCPACAAQIEAKRFLLLPVIDLTDAKAKVLRIPAEKGPGKLLTELGKVLGLEGRAEIVTKITRSKNFRYTVDAHRQQGLNPDVAAEIKNVVALIDKKVVKISEVVTRLSAAEMRRHERIAKRLALEGRA